MKIAFNKGDYNSFSDENNTVITILSLEEFKGYINELKDVYKVNFEKKSETLESESNELISPTLLSIPIENIISSIDSFQEKILNSYNSNKILFLPLIHGESRSGYALNMLLKNIKDKEDKRRYKDLNLEELNEVTSMGFLDRHTTHDVLGHGFYFYFPDFIFSLRNLLKLINNKLEIDSSYYHQEFLKEINTDAELKEVVNAAKESSYLISSLSNEIGIHETHEVLGFSPMSEGEFDKIYDAFSVLSKSPSGFEMPTLPKYIKLGYRKYSLSEDPDIRKAYNDYKESIKQTRKELKEEGVFSDLIGKIVIQYLEYL